MTAQDNARLMAEHSLRVVPIGVGQKHPPIQEWQNEATSNAEVHEAWWGPHPEWGLGWKMGAQDDGRWLFAIDVDVNKGGRESFRDLIDEYELGDEFRATTTARTGGGGFHFVFELPADSPIVPTNRSKLRAGIDVRAEGGQIVVAPTLHPTTGRAYAWEQGKAPWQEDPQIGSARLMQMIADLQAPVTLALVDDTSMSMARHPSQGGPMSPADFVHYRWDFSTFLNKHAWDHLGGERWRRPDKWDRGASAMLKGDGMGPLNVFTTEIPEALERLGRLDRSGQCISVTLFNFIAAYEHGGDTTALSRRVMADPMYIAHLASTNGDLVEAPIGERADTPTGANATVLNLPASFWTQRPHLAHIRQAAQAATCSPDALLVHALARTATFIHPCFKLPGVEQGLIGKHQTFDFLGCVIAETSGGKTMAAGVGETLIPQPDPPSDGSDPKIDFEQLVGSGEGISEFFLVDEMREDDDGKLKPTGRKVIGKQALFMSVDEGTGFTNQAGRKGATIVATLASAWSGESLGQLNASDETRRLVRGGRVRVCAVINMQETNGYKLYTEDLESVGFTGRLLFASAHDPSAPEPGTEPSWPGPLRWPIAAGNSMTNVFFTYAEEISREIRTTRYGVLTKQVEINRRQSQYLLLRCKVAGILATWEGRRHITVDDWQIATEIITMSASCLANLDAVHCTQQQVTSVTAQLFKMKVAEEATSMHVRQLQVGWQVKIIERLRGGPKTWKELKEIVDGTRRRDLKACLDQMIGDGLVVLNDKRYELAR